MSYLHFLRFERNQYMDVVSLWKSTKPADSEWYGKTAGDTYGAEHLCRLLGMTELLQLSDIYYKLILLSYPARAYRPNQHGSPIR